MRAWRKHGVRGARIPALATCALRHMPSARRALIAARAFLRAPSRIAASARPQPHAAVRTGPGRALTLPARSVGALVAADHRVGRRGPPPSERTGDSLSICGARTTQPHSRRPCNSVGNAAPPGPHVYHEFISAGFRRPTPTPWGPLNVAVPYRLPSNP
jgi:hypothetical protein